MPIHVAVISGNTDCVRVLVEHGATVMDRRAHVLFTLFVAVWFVFTSSCF
jgi:ankyrin repeat protein